MKRKANARLADVSLSAASRALADAERMLARLAGGQVAYVEELRAELIVRESTGRAPG